MNSNSKDNSGLAKLIGTANEVKLLVDGIATVAVLEIRSAVSTISHQF